MGLLVPAVLPASREDLENTLALFEQMAGVSRVQIDSVDGLFAKPATWPYTDPQRLAALRGLGEMLPHLERFEYEIDLMVLDAERAGDEWLERGASRLTFHAETTADLPRLLARMHERHTPGARVVPGLVSFGVALNLDSDIALIEAALPQADYVQFMGIARIGRKRQPFDARVFERVRAFRARHPELPVQVDGGVKLPEAKKLSALGVANVIVGSGLLRSTDPVAAAAAFDDLSNPYGV
jgi:ribulose-phosphate 3-epimerase